MKWAIESSVGRKGNFFVQMTKIGPRFGGTKKTAARYATKREAEAVACSFPALVLAHAVKV